MMMKYSVFAQIAIAIIAVVIVVTYVRPTLTEIGKVQDDIAKFNAAIEQVSSVNAMLSSLVSQVNSVSPDDRRALITYMPDTVDEVSVLRDVESMIAGVNADLVNIAYDGQIQPNTEVALEPGVLLEEPVEHDFVISVTGEYELLKQVLVNLEDNVYPLHVYNLTISPETTSLESDSALMMEMILKSYARELSEEASASAARDN